MNITWFEIAYAMWGVGLFILATFVVMYAVYKQRHGWTMFFIVTLSVLTVVIAILAPFIGRIN